MGLVYQLRDAIAVKYHDLSTELQVLISCTYSNIFHVFDEAPPVVLSKVLNLVLESIQLEF